MNDTATTDNVDVAWIVVPTILATLLYMTLVLFLWPYARPVVSIWIIVWCIVFPPFFPILTLFVIATLCYPVQNTVIVVQNRGRVVAPPVMRGSRV